MGKAQINAASALVELVTVESGPQRQRLPEGQWIVYHAIGLECALLCQDTENPREKIVPWAVFLERPIQSDGKFLHVLGTYRGVSVLVLVKIPNGARA